ncbi:hypothetical protein MTP99_013662 [Tenebrio molitor]|nr:hypothetical protein MTP99_013662 [Tenebrio molitor]
MKHQEVAQNACRRLQSKLQHDVPKKADFDSECLCFDQFPERHFELAAKVQTEKLSGDLQDDEHLFVAGFQFREEFLLQQLKCDLLVGGQDRAFSFRTPEIAKMLHNVYKGSCIGKYPLRKSFTVDLPC